MLTDTQLSKLLVNWISQTGTEYRGRMCVPADSAIRLTMYRDLIETLITTYGYSEEDLLATNTVRLVIEASWPANTPGKNTARQMCTVDWQTAVADRFPMEILKHNPDTVDTSRRKAYPENVKQEPIKKAETEPVQTQEGPDYPEQTTQEPPQEIGPMILSEEEFNYLATTIKNKYDKEFLADMLSVPASQATPNQLKKLNGIRNKILKLKKLEDSKDEIEENLDPRLLKDNPIDRSIFEGLPPVVCPDDEDFLEVLAKIRGDDE